MREEILRMNHCKEEEALEILMSLSPFEMKSLMLQILTSGELCKRESSISAKTPGAPSASFPIASNVIIRCQSAGYLSGNFSKISLSRDGIESSMPGFTFGRGINMVIVETFQVY
jgi:hypothetical protein